MCEFKFLDFTPEEIIAIFQGDIKKYQKKSEYHDSIAKLYRKQIEGFEVKIGKIRQEIRRRELQK